MAGMGEGGGGGEKERFAQLSEIAQLDPPNSLVLLFFKILHRPHLLIQRGVCRKDVGRLQLQRERIFPTDGGDLSVFFLFHRHPTRELRY